MFDVFAYLVQEYPDFSACPDAEQLARRLFAAGFEDEDIEDALSWLDLLDSAAAPEPLAQPAGGMRVFNDEEMDRLSLETRGFLQFLDANQVLDMSQRELVIERLLELPPGEVDSDVARLVVLMVLWRQCITPDILMAEELLRAIGWSSTLQ